MQANAKTDANSKVTTPEVDTLKKKKSTQAESKPKSVLALPETLTALADALREMQPSRPYRAFIVTIGSLKGGAGKTTLTVQLSGFLASLGFRVLVVDGDGQGTATKWIGDAAGNEESALSQVSCFNLAQLEGKISNGIRKYVNDYDFILVDCPPKLGGVMQGALNVSDLMLIPTRPSLPDIDSAKETLDLAYGVTSYRPQLKLAFVMTNRRPHTILSRQSEGLLNSHIKSFNEKPEGMSDSQLKHMSEQVQGSADELAETIDELGVVFLSSSTQNREVYAQSIFMGDTVTAFKSQTEAIEEMMSITSESMMLLAGVWEKDVDTSDEADVDAQSATTAENAN